MEKCLFCKKPITHNPHQKKYCNDRCKNNLYKKKHHIVSWADRKKHMCVFCGVNLADKFYCSEKCRRADYERIKKQIIKRFEEQQKTTPK